MKFFTFSLFIRTVAGFVLLACFLPVFHGCQPGKSLKLEDLDKVIEMEKGPCYGTCPVYKLTIYEKGMASYEGQQFTQYLGLHTKQLDKKVFTEIVNAFKKENFWQYKSVYKSNIPDMQTVTITYYENGESKTVKGKEGRPDGVLKLEERLEVIANSTRWEAKEDQKDGLPAYYIEDELIVQLMPDLDIHRWIYQYSRQEMKVVKSLSPNGNYWLVSFNSKLIPPRQMIDYVRKDPDILGAEFNKKVRGRN